MSIQWKGSPNYDTNRKPIRKIVIHWFGKGTLESADKRFQNPSSNVSAHYGISGETVYQWVKEENVAYHSGNYSVNQESIGIEHDATTTHDASDDTYRTSARLIVDISERFGIPIDREHIIKHSDVKPTQCPGTVDVERIIREARLIKTEFAVETASENNVMITEKTKIPQLHDMEVQQVRSILNDQGRDIKNFKEKSEKLESQNQQLSEQLETMKNQLSNKTLSPTTKLGQLLLELYFLVERA